MESRDRMNVREIEVEKLIPYANNPRNNDGAVDAVAASIKEFGFKVPIVIDSENVIVAGHTRVRAAKKLGLETVPAVIADDLTEQQIKAFRLADNRVGELATWDLEKLDIELDMIDLDMMEFGFEDNEEDRELDRQKKEFEKRMESGELSEDDEEYQEFLKKFEAKKTTDDCYTPEVVYEAVADYVARTYKVKRTSFVRPFVPGGDYVAFNYPEGCVVVDNPPFSILAEILTYYHQHGIRFFLFAPALTLFSSSSANACALCTGSNILYENGARVNTSFLTNLEPEEIRFRSAPELYRVVKEAVDKYQKEISKELPKYSYPMEVVTAPMLSPYSRYGIDFVVKKSESYLTSALDAQKDSGKAIFGKGYLISEERAAEREKAEREKAERETAEREKAEREKAERWILSDRERER